MDYYRRIDLIIKQNYKMGVRNFAICPFGEIGLEVKNILNQRYELKEFAIFDNGLININSKVLPISKASELPQGTVIINTAKSEKVYKEIQDELKASVGNGVDIIGICRSNPIEDTSRLEYVETVRNLLKTYKVSNRQLVRIGDVNDGGYVMLDDFDNAEIYSFGIGNDVSWDEEMSKYGHNVYMYDPTIDDLPYENSSFRFHRIGIAGENCEYEGCKYKTIETLLDENGHNQCDIILKMDVEGAEWDFLDNISDNVLKQIRQMTFELHDMCDKGSEDKILRILNKICKTHQAIWVHANNGNDYLDVGGAYFA